MLYVLFYVRKWLFHLCYLCFICLYSFLFMFYILGCVFFFDLGDAGGVFVFVLWLFCACFVGFLGF